LLLPFVCVAALALGVEAWRSWRDLPPTAWRSRLAYQTWPTVLGALLGLAPFLAVTIASHGVILREVLGASGAVGSGPAPGGPFSPLVALGQQLYGPFIVSLPGLFGSRTDCTACLLWAAPPLPDPSPFDGLRFALMGAAFSTLVVVCWLLAARPLVR